MTKVLTASEVRALILDRPALDAVLLPTADELLSLTKAALADAGIALDADAQASVHAALLARLTGALTGDEKP